MKFLKISLALFIFLTSYLMADTIEYFGLSYQIPTGISQNTKICILDNMAVILQNINNELKINNITDPKIISNIYKAQFQAISDSALCQFQAGKLGVSALPALVINNQYVVYGQTDIMTAIQEVQAYQEEQHVG